MKKKDLIQALEALDDEEEVFVLTRQPYGTVMKEMKVRLMDAEIFRKLGGNVCENPIVRGIGGANFIALDSGS